jgi:hypothetical protein
MAIIIYSVRSYLMDDMIRYRIKRTRDERDFRYPVKSNDVQHLDNRRQVIYWNGFD